MLRRFIPTLPRFQHVEGIFDQSLRNRTYAARWYFVSSKQLDRPTSITSQLLPRNDQMIRSSQSEQSTREKVDDGLSQLQRQIRGVQSLDELQSLLETITLDDDLILHNVLDAFFSLSKDEKSDSTRKDILHSVGIQKLCKVLRHRGRWLETNTILNVVKLLVLLGAPPSNATLQIMFRILSKQANLLSLKEISYLHFLLDKTAETSLVSALKLALPVVFESQIPVQLEKDNPSSLVDTFCYARRYQVSENNVQLILDALVEVSDQLTAKQAAIILWELSALNYTQLKNFDILKQSCFTKVTNSIESLSTTTIGTTLTKLAKKVHNMKASSNSFYNDDFVEAACNILVKRKERTSALFLAKSVSLMRHVSIEYLDYLAELLVEDPSVFLNDDRLYLSLVRVFSMANYKPQSLKLLEQALGEHPALTKDLSFQEVTIAADLLALDIFPNSLISRIFSEQYFLRLDNFLKNSSPHLLMVVYNAIKYLYPSHSGPLPPVSMVESWKNRLLNLPKQYHLKAALESGFGGDKYLISGLFHEGFHIDHGIVMRKGGFPMAINDTPRNISELQLPPDSIIVMMKAFLQESYANNTNRMRGINALELRIIEKFGHPVIPIDVTRWQALQDYEKIPFLMHKVRDVVDKYWK